MNKLPRDTIAMRRVGLGMIVASVVGFVVVLAMFTWLLVHFKTSEDHWWEIPKTIISVLMISVVFGGMGSAALVGVLLTRYHYWRGFYRCRFCRQPFKKPQQICDCPEAQKAGIILYVDDVD